MITASRRWNAGQTMIRVRAEFAKAWRDVTPAKVERWIIDGALLLTLDMDKLSESDHNFINNVAPRIWEVDGIEFQGASVSNHLAMRQIRVSARKQ